MVHNHPNCGSLDHRDWLVDKLVDEIPLSKAFQIPASMRGRPETFFEVILDHRRRKEEAAQGAVAAEAAVEADKGDGSQAGSVRGQAGSSGLLAIQDKPAVDPTVAPPSSGSALPLEDALDVARYPEFIKVFPSLASVTLQQECLAFCVLMFVS